MDFHSAVTMMNSGIPMARSSWGKTDESIVIKDGLFIRTKDGNSTPTIFFGEEILATDWEVVRIKQ